MKELIANWIMAPDGTAIPSFYSHDYRSHTSIDTVDTLGNIVSSRACTNDGGSSLIVNRSGQYTDMSVYSDDPFEVIRRFVCRGGRGVDGDKPLTWVPLFKINNNWLKAIIDYVDEDNKYLKYYKKELEYRKENNIFVEEQ